MLKRYQMRKIAYKIINSSTKLLPEWKRVLKELSLAEKLIVRDITTWWNSTYDMLNMNIEYWPGVDKMTEAHKNELHMYELGEEKWMIAKQLCDILKVSLLYHVMSHPLVFSTCCQRSWRMPLCTSLMELPHSQMWSQQWITSTRNSPRNRLTHLTIPLSELHWQ